MNSRILLIPIFITLFFASSVSSEVYSYGKDNTVIGVTTTYKIKDNESLIEIARKFGIGFNEIADSNPDLDPFVPGVGISVEIPTSWVLPDAALSNGIVINLSEMRLYYFLKQLRSMSVMTFPIGIGSEGTDTPVGNFKVIKKIVRPSWYVPESIRKEKPTLPKVVPPGPDNPLGSHALRLSLGTVLIHGTNKPYGVGRRVSHGCIRLYPEDIPRLFQSVPNGVRVTIVRQPVKVGIKNNKVYIEVHKDKLLNINYFNEAVNLLIKKNLLKRVDTEKMYYAITEKSGVPVKISN
ncbi:MAG: L,D-transpeptidase [Nitrospirae bacterium CG_4_10_14_0_8_um_filter_41_23]|nr:L,D-transpeptidase family protein [Nitrospirota bacterium]PIQ95199.1 MAG: L,D-transpeptidase [Nitrospirae bacterium CG11_big_fil_rev_8_21_14_0_20_41_14]PIV41425.1 MAG: L,D-transpeptidase [Nitrospirae bacterium CG02_land_8_20_14_3_00_41_53]PIW87653.1 MAG: L,D-transpeptidase [Nitrospirae bacterium CG_4_8_14_3_um_filter_41_47]PIY87640.1 MAG: L,D-transpeptidase [Nitrospirae bacterium CG_4_10_14_0_8_um_filter_41_23]PJA80786.1 MAG: L,D-transpeptidase [Nitrospirae bacterium CG_4_9_14_3_um_filter_4